MDGLAGKLETAWNFPLLYSLEAERKAGLQWTVQHAFNLPMGIAVFLGITPDCSSWNRRLGGYKLGYGSRTLLRFYGTCLGAGDLGPEQSP
jgi:hypothetical protein